MAAIDERRGFIPFLETVWRGKSALIPTIHLLEEFKAARWREGVWDFRFQGDSLILI